MLYELYLIFNINFLNLISIRAISGLCIAFLLTLIVIPKFIKWAKKNSIQPINELAPKNHQRKTNIPTMGGAVFVSTTILTSLLCINLHNKWAWLGILTILLFSFIGIKDDLQKILTKNNLSGMTSKVKILFQLISALIISSLIYHNDFLTTLYLPFINNPILDMGIYSILFWTLVIVSTSNAVNLTDGLDGLATFPSILVFITLSIFIYIIGNSIINANIDFSTYLQVDEVIVIAACFVGSLLGFLWFNSHPAEIFMGDSGSLTIGAFMGYLAILAKSETLLLIIGIIFVLETLSVIIQVTSFKIRRKRVFLMAPLHHHFEMMGWSENKIIIRFWIISLVFNILTIFIIKII
jgi:phospho-N-acetylmuramoyl-pentapeptide-transferase